MQIKSLPPTFVHTIALPPPMTTHYCHSIATASHHIHNSSTCFLFSSLPTPHNHRGHSEIIIRGVDNHHAKLHFSGSLVMLGYKLSPFPHPPQPFPCNQQNELNLEIIVESKLIERVKSHNTIFSSSFISSLSLHGPRLRQGQGQR